MERLFKIDHVTMSRIILRITNFIANNGFGLPNINQDNNHHLKYYVVDSTTLRIGKGKSKDTFSGYKHYHGIKLQVLVNNSSQIEAVSKAYPSSFHDKRVFLKEWKAINHKIIDNIKILGDKAYLGLNKYNLSIPFKRNHLVYKNNPLKAKLDNKMLSSKRIKIEHVFAYIKKYRILSFNFYYSIKKTELFFKAIANIYNQSRL